MRPPLPVLRHRQEVTAKGLRHPSSNEGLQNQCSVPLSGKGKHSVRQPSMVDPTPHVHRSIVMGGSLCRVHVPTARTPRVWRQAHPEPPPPPQ